MGVPLDDKEPGTVQMEELRDARGRPATVENLKEDGVYFVKFTFVDEWTDETNRFAILQRVKVVDFNDYRHSREGRFCQLPLSLEIETYKYYRFSKVVTNTVFEEHPPPTGRR